MHRDDPPTPLADPLFLFHLYEPIQPLVADRPEVLHHAHGILGPISFVNVFEPLAGEGSAGEAEPSVRSFGSKAADDHLASNTILRLPLVRPPASGTLVLLPGDRHAEGAIHPARGDHLPSYEIG